MTSFQIIVSPSRRAATRFVNDVRREIQKAYVEAQKETGITQSEIARQLGVHRSVISRQLRGREDIGLSRVAELAHVLGREPYFALQAPTDSANLSNIRPNIQTINTSSTSEVDLDPPPGQI